MNLRLTIFLVLSFSFVIQHSIAQEIELRKKVINALSGNFVDIKAIEYESHGTVIWSEEAISKHGIPEEYRGGKSSAKVRMSQDQWLLEFRAWTKSGELKNHYLDSRSQNQHAHLNALTGRMTFSKKEPTDWQFLSKYMAIFSMYAFINKTDVTQSTGSAELTLGDILSRGVWDALSAKFGDASADLEKNKIDARFMGGLCYTTKKDIVWHVTIDVKSGLPEVICSKANDGQLLVEKKIEEIGQIAVPGSNRIFYYPKKITSKDYTLLGGSKLSTTALITIEKVTVNGALLDESADYSIDPSYAKSIFDLDSNSIITLPK